MAICAYCKREKNRTGEHLISATLQNSMPNYDMVWSSVTNKVLHNTQLEIKDVCRDCNSGPLSVLDNYIKELSDRYFSVQVKNGETICFEYNYDLLARWLLKSSYNNSRAARDADCDDLASVTDYMLGNGLRPFGLTITLRLIGNLTLSEDFIRRSISDKRILVGNELPAALLYIDHKEHQIQRVNRRIIVNGFEFRVIIPRSQSDIYDFGMVVGQSNNYHLPNAMTILTPGRTQIKIPVSHLNLLEVIEDSFAKIGKPLSSRSSE